MRRDLAAIAIACAIVAGVACAPKARPLAGTPVPTVRFPDTRLAPGARRIVFTWEYQDQDGFSAKGEGVGRVVAPDSARMDFFLTGGFGGGWAILIGDRLSTPGPDVVRRLVPPAPLLWATLGRVAVPPGSDTSATVSGDTLRAEIGPSPRWRLMFVRSQLVRVERVDNGRITEFVSRNGPALHYENTAARRSLSLNVQRTEDAGGFDASIWRP